VQLVESFEPGALLLGLPLNANGSASAASRGAENLAAELKSSLGLEVHLVNEVLTSWNSKGSPDEDAEAAAQLLRDWLFQHKGSAPNSRGDL
jgi:putative Holliday junction resolvase